MCRGIALAGNLIVDHIKTIDDYPKEGNLVSISSINKSVGGAPNNVGIDLSIIDKSIPLEVIGIVGDDGDGDYVINLLKEKGLDTKGIKRDNAIGTSFTDVMTVETTGNRTFYHYRGANSLLDVEHFNFKEIKAKLLHVGYGLLLDTLDSEDEEFGTRMARLLSLAQAEGIKTSLDVVSEESDRYKRVIPPSLKYCNYFIANELEASLTTGIQDRDAGGNLIVPNMEKMCRRLIDMGVNDLVVLHAPEGGFAMDNRGEYYIQPSLSLPEGYIKGAVGAGDAFCAGILYSLYMDWDVQKALEVAVSSAACCLSHINATDGMKDIAAIESLFATMEKGEL